MDDAEHRGFRERRADWADKGCLPGTTPGYKDPAKKAPDKERDNIREDLGAVLDIEQREE